MATQNDFLPFATGPGANVVDQATYAALSALTTGFLSGTAQSVQLNKVWRQSSIMAAVIAQFIVAQTGQAAVDDGTTATLLANFTKAVNAASKQRVILADTGSANSYAAANPVPMTVLPTVSGVVQTISVKATNTGASTYSPDGLASRPIFGLGGAALQGGEMVANGIATLVSYAGPLLNGGSLCWVLFECIGGGQQVAAATQPQHAMQLGQAIGRLLNVRVFTSSQTYNPTPGTTSIVVEMCGGGGGSGGSVATNASQSCATSAGSHGSYAKARYTSNFSGLLVTIGSGGVAGGTSGKGGDGGTSSFGSLLTCPGGGGAWSSAPTGGTITSSTGAAAAAPVGYGILTSTYGLVPPNAIQASFGVATNFAAQQGPFSGSLMGKGADGIYIGQSTNNTNGNPGNSGGCVIWEYA
ncbi:hypothetical protein [Burkholderia ubonensis]|uniref:hypothetical protein n=1 Tax=Burkholderia ubonensis TaxID=101571 RepID=UPI000B2F4301|nr:hypothetical protein [Burkholderia ubonensis]